LKLRGRFTLWFCLAALIPIAAAALVTRTILNSALRDEAQTAREASETEMQRLLSGAQSSIAGKLKGLASKDDPYVGGTLLDLVTEGGQLQALARQRLHDLGAPLMRQLSLDLLYLLDSRAQVLDAPHYLPSLGEELPELRARAKRSGGTPYYVMEPTLEGGVIKKILVIEAARELRDGGDSVTVVGGRRIDSAFLDPIRNLPGVQVRIVGAGGETLVAANGEWKGDKTVSSHILKDSQGQQVAAVEMRQANDALPALLQQVTIYSALLALAALLVTVLLGFLVARRMTSSLDALVVGVQAAARGELDHQVEIRSADEIGAVGTAFNTMMLDLHDSKERLVMAERVAAWQEIARRLAHEIKNPLTPIQMSMETLRKTYAKKHPSFDEVFEESTATVLEEAARLKRIVSEFSEFARMPKPTKTLLSLNDLVRSQVALYKGSVAISKSFEEDLPMLEADKDTLSQLLLNLIENARDAIGDSPDGKIRVSTESSRGGRAVIVRVDDNGPGIAPDVKDKLFTPYYTTKHAHGGTGLGLAIAHRIVSDHHGRIAATDSPWGGARFTVELPAQGAGDEVLLATMSGKMPRFK
jgi:signal transduction histidine kinase